MENRTEISFIIPVYNGASVISRQLASVFRLEDSLAWEVIAVDDGSEDNTLEILKEAAEKEPRLKVISQANAGQSSARNAGLRKAEGEYVFFADADDTVSAEGLLKLYHTAKQENYDIVCGTYVRTESGKPPYRACEGLRSGRVSRNAKDRDLFDALKTESVFGYLWTRLFKRSFLLEQGLLFDDTIRVYMEDQLFNLKAFGCGADLYFQNEVVYEYHFEGESTTRKADPEIAGKSVEMLRSYEAFLREKGIRKENLDLFVPLSMRMACWAAYKNIPYEGASFSRIRERLDLFANEEALKFMFEMPESRYYLKSLLSFLQRRFFGMTFSLLKRKKTGLLAFVFVLGSPFIRAAVRSMVR